jgi:hypothetical protein
MRSNYIIIALSALTLGFSVSLWRASGETDLQTQATQTALAAQVQLATLSEELVNERKARNLAEAAERLVQDQLTLESKARETAQGAHDKAADRAAAAAQGLAEQMITTKKQAGSRAGRFRKGTWTCERKDCSPNRRSQGGTG